MKNIIRLILLVTLSCQLIFSNNDEDTFECVKGVSYVLNKVIPCKCGPPPFWNKFLMCDMVHCVEKPYVKENCTFGKTWLMGCNTCWCRPMGEVCTKFQCQTN